MYRFIVWFNEKYLIEIHTCFNIPDAKKPNARNLMHPKWPPMAQIERAAKAVILDNIFMQEAEEKISVKELFIDQRKK